MIYQFDMLPDEHWWGGSSNDGLKEPFHAASCHRADYNDFASNQTMPLYLSDRGRYIWSEEGFVITIENGCIQIEGNEVVLVNAGSNLRDAYLAAMKAHFPFSAQKLPERFFKVPQYNTWMQFTYNPTQQGVLQYAHEIIDHGFTPGILMIDEGWNGRYGYWQFDRAKFPNPKAMVEELHAMGFTVMLWVVPYVCPDGPEFVKLTDRQFNPQEFDKHFLRNANGEYAFVRWWNGYSLILDFTNPYDCKFLKERLRFLMEEYGIDGFKFDGGDLYSYADHPLITKPRQTAHTPGELNIAWNHFGMQYQYHEYKDTWKGGGKAVIQRLRDRSHTWQGNGIDSLIPSALVCSMIGHPYICPDMIGGGEWTYRDLYHDQFDPELFVRMAEASALFPMMQFSWAPWDDLNEEYVAYVRQMADLHSQMAEEILRFVESARITGEPIMRPLEYNHPGQGYADIKDEFMLGCDILVAPVLQKGAVSRTVVFPTGRWQDQNDGTVYTGPNTHTVNAPLHVLPWFRKVQE